MRKEVRAAHDLAKVLLGIVPAAMEPKTRQGWRTEMTREDVIQFGKRKYGEQWIARLAADLGYSVSSIMRLMTGETSEVSRRMELEMEKLIRQHRFAALAKPDVRY